MTADEVRNALTRTQLRVLKALAAGKRQEQIASELGINLRTVEMHVADIRSRLGAETTTEAAVVAARAGVV